MEIDFDKVAKRLKLIREESFMEDGQKMTLEYVGNSLGIHKSTVSRWESGETESMKLPIIDALAKLYNVSPLWLSGLSDDKQIKMQPKGVKIPVLRSN